MFLLLFSDTLYPLDLTKEKGLVVRIGKRLFGRTFTPVCVICKGATDCDNELVIEGGKYYRISFLCKDLNSLTVTAENKIGMNMYVYYIVYIVSIFLFIFIGLFDNIFGYMCSRKW